MDWIRFRRFWLGGAAWHAGVLFLALFACGESPEGLGLPDVGVDAGPDSPLSGQPELQGSGTAGSSKTDSPQTSTSSARARSAVLTLAAFPEGLALRSAPVDCGSDWEAFYLENVGHAPIEVETVFAKDEAIEIEPARNPPFTLYPADPFYIRVRGRAPSLVPISSAVAIEGRLNNQRGWLDVPISYQADPWRDTTDTFTLGRTPTANVVFVISSAPSMAQEQDSLRSNLQTWASGRSRGPYLSRVAVTSMDLFDEGGGFIVDQDGDEPWLLTEDSDFGDRFMERAMVGAAGSSTTEARTALVDLLGRPEAQAMLTEDYGLSLVFIMDTDDDSIITSEEFWEFFSTLPHSGATGAVVNGGTTGCETMVAHALPAPRLNASDTPFQVDFCSPTWGRNLNTWPPTTVPNREFLLSGEPAHGEVVVQVDGQLVPEIDELGRRRWSLPRRDTLFFSDVVRIEEPQSLTVSYRDAACFHWRR